MRGAYSKAIENLVVAYTQHFTPRLFKDMLGDNEVPDVLADVEMAEMLFHGLEKAYVGDMQCWTSVNKFKCKV